MDISSSSQHTILPMDPEAKKRIINMLNRIEKTLVPEMQQNPFSEKFSFYGREATRGKYFHTLDIHKPTGVTFRDVNWSLVEADINTTYQSKMGHDAVLPPKAQAEIDLEKKKQDGELQRLRSLELLKSIRERNNNPVMPGKWRKVTFF